MLKPIENHVHIEDLEALENPGINSIEHLSIKAKPYEWGYGSTPRTAGLRDGLYSKAVVVRDWSNILAGLGKCTFRKGVKIDVDRARLVTESDKETEGLPKVIRRALVMQKLCEEMPIFIEPGQLLVGDPNSAPNEIRWFPEVACDYMVDAVKPEGGFGNLVTDEERAQVLEICDYWKGHTQEELIKAALPEAVLPFVNRSLENPSFCADHWNSGRNLIGFDFEVLLKEGLKARMGRVEAKLAELDDSFIMGTAEVGLDEYLEKKRNWQAQIIAAKAIIRFGERHAELAEEQAKKEKDATRKEELEEIARICRKVPGSPPDSFHEALQAYWFIDVVGRYLVGPNNGYGARLDQIWFPYYEKDIRGGRITRAKAKELIECLMLRIQTVGAHAEHPGFFTVIAGGEVFYTANVGGTHMDGTDACNDLTALLLECLAVLRVNQPPLMVRFHKNMSEDMITRITETARAGTGHPAIFNEALLEKWALDRGYSAYDAKRTQAAGCVSMNCTGKPLGGSFFVACGFLAQPKVLEYALFQGGDAFGNGNKVGNSKLTRPKTKNPREMASADELLEAHCEQMRFYLEIANISHNISHRLLQDISPDPVTSFLLDDTLEQGKDLHKAWTEFDTFPNVVSLGLINVTDSLSAIQKLVFDEKKYTMDQLINALRTNWEGQEAMRQDFLNAPKYGNDDDFADGWAVKVKVRTQKELTKVKDAWGRAWDWDGSSVIAYQAMASSVGATADGRHAGNILADGTRSPSAGSDCCGPTAVLNSVAKVPFYGMELFNQRVMPQFLEGENKVLFNEYLKEWNAKMTIPHIQFNVVDSKVLRDAQKNPEAYPYLQVRIAGYSAFFVDLAPETQESIIQRTDQVFC
ncbi:MAG: pyruvate formate lyase family protein [Syntrophales bacterium]|nr:pyruvate formate lyase family protein [Syntrophales bacterium]